MPEDYVDDEGGPDREELMDLGLDPDEPDFTELAAEGMTGEETDDEDLRDADEDVAAQSTDDED
jgi:hypothetical protein